MITEATIIFFVIGLAAGVVCGLLIACVMDYCMMPRKKGKL
jgi:hypothetical protein